MSLSMDVLVNFYNKALNATFGSKIASFFEMQATYMTRRILEPAKVDSGQ